MFDSNQQNKDWMKLMQAADEAEHSPVCENFPDAFFPEKGASGLATEIIWAKKTCGECPIRDACANYGLKWEDHGIWGGLTAVERRAMRSTVRR